MFLPLYMHHGHPGFGRIRAARAAVVLKLKNPGVICCITHVSPVWPPVRAKPRKRNMWTNRTRKKIVIFTLAIAVIVGFAGIGVIAGRPPSLHVGETLSDPRSYFNAQVQAN